MKTRGKILIVAGIFLALAAASLVFNAHLQPENAVAAYKKILRARGEKLKISEVAPPPVPAQSNSVDAVEEAFQLLAPSPANIPQQMIMVAPGKAMTGWAQPDARDYDFTNSWEDFAADIAVDQPALDLLHEVLDRPTLDFQLDYQKGAALLLPHLVPLKRATQKLDAAAICELHFGDTGAAATNILTMLGFVQKNSGESLLISHLVRIAIAAIAVSPTWELLQKTNLPDAQLAALQQGWSRLGFFADAQNAFEMERAWSVNIIEKLRHSPDQLDTTLGGYGSYSGGGSGWLAMTKQLRYGIGKAMWCSSWSYSDELRLLKSETIVLQTLRAMRTNQSQFYQADYDAMETKLSSLGITNVGAAFFRALKIPDFSNMLGGRWLGTVVSKTIRIETARRIVVTAIALKRFQQQNGRWPQSLKALTPKFLPSVPIDPYSGKPLRYHPNADGTYLLYSVGADGVDDGGDPTDTAGSSLYWQNDQARDTVWPQPATAAEIKYFREHPPK